MFEDDVSGVDALDDRLSAGGFDRRQSVGEHRGEDVDHLPIAVIDASKLAPHALHGDRQYPIFSTEPGPHPGTITTYTNFLRS